MIGRLFALPAALAFASWDRSSVAAFAAAKRVLMSCLNGFSIGDGRGVVGGDPFSIGVHFALLCCCRSSSVRGKGPSGFLSLGHRIFPLGSRIATFLSGGDGGDSLAGAPLAW